jgi:hypothetical protein
MHSTLLRRYLQELLLASHQISSLYNTSENPQIPATTMSGETDTGT